MSREHVPTDTLQDDLRAARHRFVDQVAPFRPDLHRYCRRLTRNVWEAEDPAQEALLRTFGHLGSSASRSTTRAATCFARRRTSSSTAFADARRSSR